MKPTTTKQLCRAGVIAALYAVLTYVFLPFAFGPFQIRPAEALCILPLFFPEAVPALAVGCFLSNLASPYLAYDLTVGTLTTLLSAMGTYFVGKCIKGDYKRIVFGGSIPVLANALILPLFLVLLSGETYKSLVVGYFAAFGSIFLTECIWVFVLGTPLYFVIKSVLNK